MRVRAASLLTLAFLTACAPGAPASDALRNPDETGGARAGWAFWDISPGQPKLMAGWERICAAEAGVNVTNVDFRSSDNLSITDWAVIPIGHVYVSGGGEPQSLADYGLWADNREVPVCEGDESYADVTWEAVTESPGPGVGAHLIISYGTASGGIGRLELQRYLVLCQQEDECVEAERDLLDEWEDG